MEKYYTAPFKIGFSDESGRGDGISRSSISDVDDKVVVLAGGEYNEYGPNSLETAKLLVALLNKYAPPGKVITME